MQLSRSRTIVYLLSSTRNQSRWGFLRFVPKNKWVERCIKLTSVLCGDLFVRGRFRTVLRSPNKPQLVPQVRRRTLVACQRVASVQVYFDAGDIWWTWDSSEALETLLPKKSSFDNLFRTSAAGYGNSQIKPELLRSTCFSLLRKTLRSFQVGRFGIQLVLSVGLN